MNGCGLKSHSPFSCDDEKIPGDTVCPSQCSAHNPNLLSGQYVMMGLAYTPQRGPELARQGARRGEEVHLCLRDL